MKEEKYNPGFEPVEYKVIVFPDPVDVMTENGIFEKPIETQIAERRMRTRGILVSASDMAFEDWKCRKPKSGDLVEYTMYAGQFFIGDDEKEYKVMNDKDIAMVRSK